LGREGRRRRKGDYKRKKERNQRKKPRRKGPLGGCLQGMELTDTWQATNHKKHYRNRGTDGRRNRTRWGRGPN